MHSPILAVTLRGLLPRRNWLPAILLFVLVVVPLEAQTALEWWADSPVATGELGIGRFSEVGMLYERTFLKVDVLELSMRFDPVTADRLERLVGGSEYDGRADRRFVDIAMEAEGVLVRSRFLRGISLDQFLDGTRENLGDARAAGLLSEEEFGRIVADIEVSYEPLRGPGIRAGDELWYRVRGDRVHIVFRSVDGERVVDELVEGSEHRRAVLGGYLAPGSDFRGPLARSLFEGRTD